ncbi:MAG TPA: LysR family transcriptional regulator, partial [Polyangiaceae bacterium]|nr:LysR family transcriptional regulator [Polyangiaceae bacterium]
MQGRVAPQEQLQWDDVRLFLALCRARTVGSAAKSLGVDASTASRRLVLLERALAVKLFERGRDGISATKAAEDLLPLAEEMESVATRFAHASEGLERAAEGLVRVTCPADVAEVVLVPMLGELRKRHPALRVELVPAEAVLDLTRGEADIALRTVRPVRGDLVVTRLTSARWVLAGAPRLVRRMGTLRAFRDAPWVGWGARYAGIAAARWLATHAADVEPLFRSDSLRVQIAALTAGVGVALVPEPSLVHYGLRPVKLGASLR